MAGAVTLALARGAWGTTELIWGAAAHPSSRGLPGYELGVSRRGKTPSQLDCLRRAGLGWECDIGETRVTGASAYQTDPGSLASAWLGFVYNIRKELSLRAQQLHSRSFCVCVATHVPTRLQELPFGSEGFCGCR